MNPLVLVAFLGFWRRITEGDLHPFLFTENRRREAKSQRRRPVAVSGIVRVCIFMDHWILQFMARKIAFDQYDWMTRSFIFCARKIQKIHANSNTSLLQLYMYTAVVSYYQRAKNASLFSVDGNRPHLGIDPHLGIGPHLIMTVNSHTVLPRICMKYQNI